MIIMCMKVLLSSLLSGTIMSVFVGFNKNSHWNIPIKRPNIDNSSIGCKVRSIRALILPRLSGWQSVIVRLGGMIIGLFVPLYLFFYSPMSHGKLTEIGLACYLLLAMVLVKISNEV